MYSDLYLNIGTKWKLIYTLKIKRYEYSKQVSYYLWIISFKYFIKEECMPFAFFSSIFFFSFFNMLMIVSDIFIIDWPRWLFHYLYRFILVFTSLEYLSYLWDIGSALWVEMLWRPIFSLHRNINLHLNLLAHGMKMSTWPVRVSLSLS